jgi:hypothetical protein
MMVVKGDDIIHENSTLSMFIAPASRSSLWRSTRTSRWRRNKSSNRRSMKRGSINMLLHSRIILATFATSEFLGLSYSFF